MTPKRRTEAKYLSRVELMEFERERDGIEEVGEANMESKLAPKWIGPYRIGEVVGKGAYRLKMEGSI
ncbi:hypothetical protein ACSQ67_001048 [Phaseolus vulgaris]